MPCTTSAGNDADDDSVGLKIEAQHHEVATGARRNRHAFRSLVEMADKLLNTVHHQDVAKKHGKTATFIAQPLFMDNGSGMHVHSSLWKTRQPFMPVSGYAGCPTWALYAIGGFSSMPRSVRHHAIRRQQLQRWFPAMSAVNLAYSRRNRSLSPIPVLAQPQGEAAGVPLPGRLEQPLPGLRRHAHGDARRIKNKIKPGEPLDKDIYDLEPEELAKVPKAPARSTKPSTTSSAITSSCCRAMSSPATSSAPGSGTTGEGSGRHPAAAHPYEFALYYDI